MVKEILQNQKNRVMIRKSVIAVLMIFSVISISAQQRHKGMENKSPDEAAEMVTKKMIERLGLTNDQANKTKEIYTQFFTKRQALKKEYPQLEQAKEELKAVKESEKNRVKSILTEEQLQKMKSMRRMEHGEKSKNKSHDQRLAMMKENLNLTSKQEAELKAVFEDSATKRKEIKSKYPELEEAKKQMKTLKKDMKAQLKEVLTDEQYEQWESSRKKGHGKKGHGKRR